LIEPVTFSRPVVLGIEISAGLGVPRPIQMRKAGRIIAIPQVAIVKREMFDGGRMDDGFYRSPPIAVFRRL